MKREKYYFVYHIQRIKTQIIDKLKNKRIFLKVLKIKI